ncbi:MAG TPA: sugar phosphate nucleotidyltransferase [Puia sp.]|jgi:D-glycero-alpha-D-manno-heptose 1-phosphate guanylyltransferase|nr:sugar phosphate nucleotidyltransferase [Puia sp.]
MGGIKEAIILAGGLGTRLRSAVPDLPKCLAPVGGRPFLGFVTDHFRREGIEKFIFALGYKSDYFDTFLRTEFPDGGYDISLEEAPLGTGGAIRQACGLVEGKTALILNGDTFFRIGLKTLADFHAEKQADCSLCLKPMRDFDRFGVVEMTNDGRVRSFREKQYYSAGLINGGVYALEKAALLREEWPKVFSFEKDYLEATRGERLYGLVQDSYFIDIGIPEDYRRAQDELNELS